MMNKLFASLFVCLALVFSAPAPAVAKECQTVDMFLKKVNLPEQVAIYQLTGEKATKLSEALGIPFDEFYMARLDGQRLGVLLVLKGCTVTSTVLPELQWMDYMRALGIVPEDFKEYKGKAGA